MAQRSTKILFLIFLIKTGKAAGIGSPRLSCPVNVKHGMSVRPVRGSMIREAASKMPRSRPEGLTPRACLYFIIFNSNSQEPGGRQRKICFENYMGRRIQADTAGFSFPHIAGRQQYAVFYVRKHKAGRPGHGRICSGAYKRACGYGKGASVRKRLFMCSYLYVLETMPLMPGSRGLPVRPAASRPRSGPSRPWRP